MLQIVNIANCKCSRQKDDILVTYSLGSCLGVAIYDLQEKIGGLAHFPLPSIKDSLSKNSFNLYEFVDVGFDSLLSEIYKLGGRKENLIIKVAGGASIWNNSNIFNIGKKNIAMLEKCIINNKLKIFARDIAGNLARTMYLYIDDGTIMIKTSKGTYYL